jgi:hypothetical protein
MKEPTHGAVAIVSHWLELPPAPPLEVAPPVDEPPLEVAPPVDEPPLEVAPPVDEPPLEVAPPTDVSAPAPLVELDVPELPGSEVSPQASSDTTSVNATATPGFLAAFHSFIHHLRHGCRSRFPTTRAMIDLSR